MNIDLGQYVIPTIAVFVYIVCHLLKLWLENKEMQKKVIPTVAAILGVILSVILHGEITIEVAMIGLVSGLSSTGFNQAIKLFEPNTEKESEGKDNV